MNYHLGNHLDLLCKNVSVKFIFNDHLSLKCILPTNIGTSMSIKMHFFLVILTAFLKILKMLLTNKVNDSIKISKSMVPSWKTRYHGFWEDVIVADYCWILKRETPLTQHLRSVKKRKFVP